MPKGVYKRGSRRGGEPLPVPPMPARRGKWRAATRRAWAAWFTSGRASLLDDAGLTALERLVKIIDEADRQGWPQKLAREVRLQEAALAATVAPPARRIARAGGDERWEEHQRERCDLKEAERAACASVGVSIAAYELAPLMDPEPEWAGAVIRILREQGWESAERRRL